VTVAVAFARRGRLLATLALLYIAQGLPFGLAAEYLPILLREAQYTRTQLLGVQLALAALLAAYAPFAFASHARVWFGLTAACALVAATQDTLVDGLAVRSLAPQDRGLGNIAQVAPQFGVRPDRPGLSRASGHTHEPSRAARRRAPAARTSPTSRLPGAPLPCARRAPSSPRRSLPSRAPAALRYDVPILACAVLPRGVPVRSAACLAPRTVSARASRPAPSARWRAAARSTRL